MTLFEYEAKEIPAQYGVPVTENCVVDTVSKRHAGTLSVYGNGNAHSKNAPLKAARACVVNDVKDVAQAMADTMVAA